MARHDDTAGNDDGGRANRQGHAEPPARDWRTVTLRVVGAGLLIATGAIHLDLYLTGYRSIPAIGWPFLLQVIAAFGLALAVLAIPSRLVAAAAAVFPLATLGGYLLSVWIGLFGFTEVRTTAGIVAGVVEVAAFVVLAALTLAPTPAGSTTKAPARFPAEISPAIARAAARALLRRAVDLGVQLIDTADAYGPGVSEELIAPVTLPIPGTATPTHLEDNLAAAAIQLEQDEIHAITAAASRATHRATQAN